MTMIPGVPDQEADAGFGAAIGFLLLGPIGALAGGVLGYLAGASTATQLTAQQRAVLDDEIAQAKQQAGILSDVNTATQTGDQAGGQASIISQNRTTVADSGNPLLQGTGETGGNYYDPEMSPSLAAAANAYANAALPLTGAQDNMWGPLEWVAGIFMSTKGDATSVDKALLTADVGAIESDASEYNQSTSQFIANVQTAAQWLGTPQGQAFMQARANYIAADPNYGSKQDYDPLAPGGYITIGGNYGVKGAQTAAQNKAEAQAEQNAANMANLHDTNQSADESSFGSYRNVGGYENDW